MEIKTRSLQMLLKTISHLSDFQRSKIRKIQSPAILKQFLKRPRLTNTEKYSNYNWQHFLFKSLPHLSLVKTITHEQAQKSTLVSKELRAKQWKKHLKKVVVKYMQKQLNDRLVNDNQSATSFRQRQLYLVRIGARKKPLL